MSVIHELIIPLPKKSGLLAYLDYTANKLSELKKTNDPQVKTNASETEKYLLNKLKQLNSPKKSQDIYCTREGRILKAFEKLYAIYGNTLARELRKIAVPLDFTRILYDRNTYWRFMNFYDIAILLCDEVD